MRFSDSILGEILKPICHRWFDQVVARHEADAYDKCFTSWDHLVLLIYAQLSGVGSLRNVVATWNANANQHYHLGCDQVARSTVSDAGTRRPLAVFTEVFDMLSGQVDRATRREGEQMLTLIDSTPIQLGKIVDWAKWNGRIRGLKLHVAYNPVSDNPTQIQITDANINDVTVGEQFKIEAGTAYIFDKAYCKYRWWTAIHEAEATFVTRQKTSAKFRATHFRKLEERHGDGFQIIDDAEVKFISKSKGGFKLSIPMRRIRLRRDEGTKITLLTNDMTRSAVEIAALYKMRWQIELLFRWIKQHLQIKKLISNDPNAIRLQIVAAMIAYVLLRMAAHRNLVKIPIIRFAALVAVRIFARTQVALIDKPLESHPSKPKPKRPIGQLEFGYA